MPEPTQIIFTHKEIVELMLKKQGIHEGIWGLIVNFSFQATNVTLPGADPLPAAVVPITAIGLQKFEKENNIAVDAAKVNPKPSGE